MEGVGEGALIKDINRDRLQMIDYSKKQLKQKRSKRIEKRALWRENNRERVGK